jgi:hypothetical protein
VSRGQPNGKVPDDSLPEVSASGVDVRIKAYSVYYIVQDSPIKMYRRNGTTCAVTYELPCDLVNETFSQYTNAGFRIPN